jgi:hypothetical protein
VETEIEWEQINTLYTATTTTTIIAMVVAMRIIAPLGVCALFLFNRMPAIVVLN